MSNTNLPESIIVGAGDFAGDAEVAWAEINRLSRTTGLRDITSLLANGWTATGVWLERVQDWVYLYVQGLDGSAATAAAALTGLDGCQPFAATRSAVLWDSSAAPAARLTVTSTQVLATTGVVFASQVQVMQWRTTTAFPAEIDWPGVAV